jgi:hypothetical protein
VAWLSEIQNAARLELLGEMIRRLQADVRTLRDENKTTRQLMLDGFTAMNDRMANLEARLDSRIDQLAEITFAIADKLGVEYRR